MQHRLRSYVVVGGAVVVAVLQIACNEVKEAVAEVKATSVDQEFKKDQGRFLRMCDSGDGVACTALGKAYVTGGSPLSPGAEGVPKDVKRGLAFLEKGCEKGCETGCYDLGAMYATGDGVAQDKKLALEFYRKACDLKSSHGCLQAGAHYGNSEGVESARSLSFFKKACDLGNKKGCDMAERLVRMHTR